MDMTGDQPQDVIHNFRWAMAQSVVQNKDPSNIITQLLQIDKPLAEKFVCLKFSDLLAKNGQSVDSLKKLIMGLNILEKYGRHLLKPQESRSNMWRHIKYTNTIFRERVNNMQGGREIMAQMGYSVNKDDGVAFPDNGEPDLEQVLNLVMDILLAKKEIEAYLCFLHPYPQYLETYLHPDLVANMKSELDRRRLPQTVLPSHVDSSNPPISYQDDSQASLQPEKHEGPKSKSSIESKPSTSLSDGQARFVTASEGKAEYQESESPAVSVTCDICGKNHPELICVVCDNKQLCQDCDITWHKHPKRQNHKRTPLGCAETIAPTTAAARPEKGVDTGPNNLLFQEGGQPREPMSMYPSQPSNILLANMGYSLPAGHIVQQAYTAKPGLQRMEGIRSSCDSSVPKQDPTTPSNSQHWSRPNSNGSDLSPRITGSLYEGGFPGIMSTSQATPGAQPRALNVQGTSQINVVNPLQYGQPSVQYPVSLAVRPQHSYGMGYSVAPGLPAQMQPYTSYVPSTMHMFGSHDMSRFGCYPQLSAQNLYRHQGYPYAPQTPNKSIDSPFGSRTLDIPRTPSTASVNSVSSVSQLLPDIQKIKDPEKRMSRIRIDIMSLQDDIKQWDEKINSIILCNPNFFQDEEYMNLNRKKRKHLQEISELQNYSNDLQKELDENADNERRENQKRISMEKEELEQLRNRMSEIKASDPLQQHHQFYAGSQAPYTGMYSQCNVAPNLAGPTLGSSDAQLRQPGHAGSPSGTGDNMEEIRKVLLLDHNPHALKTDLNQSKQPAMNIPVTNLKLPQEAAYPPYMGGAVNQPFDTVVRPKHGNPPAAPRIPNNSAGKPNTSRDSTAMKHGHSEPNLVTNNEKNIPDIRKNQSAVDVTNWQCEHCTYQNESSNNVCSMCFKTTENRKISGQKGSLAYEPIGEECEFCTFMNKPGTKVCEMCSQAQPKYAETDPGQPGLGGASMAAGGKEARATLGSPRSTREETAAGHGTSGTKVGQLIDEEQDKVFLEKVAAQERFKKDQKKEARGPANILSPPVRPGPPLNICPAATGSQLAPNRDIERIRKLSEQDQSSGSSSSYGSAQSSLESAAVNQSTPEMGKNESQGAVKKGKPQLDFAVAIEQINMKREQEQMSIDGHDFIQRIKEAEMAGFEIKEIEIAQRLGLQDKMKPLEWLRQKWDGMLDLVATMATEMGKAAEQNSVGDLSREEAREALIQCEANLEKAAKLCVEQRTAKYAEISSEAEFAREDILTALYQNHGSVDNARDQLNHAVLQSYADRLWTEAEGSQGGDAAMAAAARAPDPNNSMSNSIIGHEEFQRVIKDTHIDRERRVRMVFVEGKLTSWGRADTVITILDKDLNGIDEPLECTIEDIIEAVRNCGDRKSSLIYLRQECGICFGQYPMSKIRSLSMCDCKLCYGCVKQNFEVVVRERYVRNWNCPICDQPDFEDETKASQYFEFLTLILRAMVSQEVQDLFETKLRDWHLQKDENFRWCAHCASGFIWDRPDVLGMTCPHCSKKTCFKCKKKWEDQHEGLTCEDYTQWCIDNDPAKQAKGVQVYLEQNGIDCPSCKMRYELAKGGCMHFKCPQCGHEFCSGCYQPFLKDGVCKLFASCANKGLHCHHPRDCFYWLRDYDAADLQKLLKSQQVYFNTDAPPTQEDKTHCPVMEQKEYEAQKKDEACNKQTQKGMAGLCEGHYKEYLVDLINKHNIDPLPIMSQNSLIVLIQRHERNVPPPNQGDSEAVYRKRLIQFIKENFKLPKK